jgi:VIT1/CCC1 family predicted Fe2+/Mn2+ transporter
MIDTIAKLILAALTLAMFGAIAAYCLLNNPTEAIRQQLITAVVGWGGIAIGFYFGSSAGSSSKDKTINTLTTKGP